MTNDQHITTQPCRTTVAWFKFNANSQTGRWSKRHIISPLNSTRTMCDHLIPLAGDSYSLEHDDLLDINSNFIGDDQERTNFCKHCFSGCNEIPPRVKMESKPRYKFINLIEKYFEANGPMDRILETNQGSDLDKIVRLAAVAEAQAMIADGFVISGSFGLCVLGFRKVVTVPKCLNSGFNVRMVGQSGTHDLFVSDVEFEFCQSAITARVKLHWLEFVKINGVDVPEDELTCARIAARTEVQWLDKAKEGNQS